MKDVRSIRRSRAVYALATLSVIALGLLWRSHLLHLPWILSKYGGDALWALMVFCGFRIIFNRLSTFKLSTIALGFSWAVEF